MSAGEARGAEGGRGRPGRGPHPRCRWVSGAGRGVLLLLPTLVLLLLGLGAGLVLLRRALAQSAARSHHPPGRLDLRGTDEEEQHPQTEAPQRGRLGPGSPPEEGGTFSGAPSVAETPSATSLAILTGATLLATRRAPPLPDDSLLGTSDPTLPCECFAACLHERLLRNG